MYHRLRRNLLTLVRKTPFEGFLRQVYGTLCRDQGTTYDREMRQVTRRVLKSESNAIDVGAYRGETLREMLRVASDGTVLAVDPIPENCAYLREKFPGAFVHNLALSDQDGEAVFFHVVGRPARSSLREQHYPDPEERVEKIQVKTMRLDDLVPADTRFDLLKIDVEGAELHVMRGAVNLIRSSRPVIIFEYLPELAEPFHSSPEQVFDFLSNTCGMKLSSMKRWLRRESPYRRQEFAETVRSNLDFTFIAYPLDGCT